MAVVNGVYIPKPGFFHMMAKNDSAGNSGKAEPSPYSLS